MRLAVETATVIANQLRLIVFAIAALYLGFSNAEPVYKWVDESGVVHYSDQPPAEHEAETELTPLPNADVAVPSSAQAGASPYPPEGSPEPAAVCKRPVLPRWLGFYCSFMTEELWVNAGRPDFWPDPDGRPWAPTFSRGILEALQPARSAGLKTQVRFAPWSQYVRQRLNCENGMVANPFYLANQRAELRPKLLSMGWDVLPTDPNDPTSLFEQGAMFALFSLAHLPEVLGLASSSEDGSVNLQHELSRLVDGAGRLSPDYERDAAVARIPPIGSVTWFERLEDAVQYLVQARVIVTNDAQVPLERSISDARLIADMVGQDVVQIYFAEDILNLPWSEQDVFRKRLDYLMSETVRVLGSKRIRVVSHGRSVHFVQSVVMQYENVYHTALAPAPGSWGMEDLLKGVRDSRAKIKIITGSQDFYSALGGGSTYELKEACLDGGDGGGATE